MRKILIKWLLQIGQRFRVGDDTIHICVQLIDHFLIHETGKINRNNYQLLGITALFVASKYNEIYSY